MADGVRQIECARGPDGRRIRQWIGPSEQEGPSFEEMKALLLKLRFIQDLLAGRDARPSE